MIATADMLAAGAPARRRPCAPSLASLVYAKEAMTVVLLALAFVWLLPRLIRRPGRTLEAVGKSVAGRV